MIPAKTVLILGAGASAPYHLPTGLELHDEVCKRLSDETHFRLFSAPRLAIPAQTIKDFRRDLLASRLFSVDLFLEKRFDNAEYLKIGKAAIASILLEKERSALLPEHILSHRITCRSENRPEEEWPQDWYQLLWAALTRDTYHLDHFPNNDLQVITFNYDRSFEHFLMEALQATYGKSETECATMLNANTTKFEIVHVHGNLGRLPWQASDNRNIPALSYNTAANAETISQASQDIKIVPEAHANTWEFKRARELLSRPSRIHFLGFGFLPENLKKLDILKVMEMNPAPRGTAYNVSKMTEDYIRSWHSYWRPFNAGNFRKLRIYDYLYNHVNLTE